MEVETTSFVGVHKWSSMLVSQRVYVFEETVTVYSY